MSGSTGSGSFVGSNSPTITTPRIAQINDTNGNEILGLPATASAVNFVTITNAIATGTPIISTNGSDANIFMNFQTKGTAGYRWFDGSSNEVFSLTAIASSVNYLDIKNAATGSGPSLTAFGTDTNIAINYNSKGSGFHLFYSNAAIATAINGQVSGVNYFTLQNATTGFGPNLYASGSDTNININLIPQGTGIVAVNGGLTMASGTQIILAKANGTEAANAVTASGNAGVITTSSLTTAGGASYAITWTNTKISSTSVIHLSIMGGTNTTENITLKATAGSGTSTLTIYNNTAVTALNGTILIGYTVF